GSVKSNIGHAESASGIAGLTKVLLQMRYGQLVPSLHAEVLNPHIDFEATPFVVQRELSAWQRPLLPGTDEGKGVPRRAGISSFGAGGSNAHVILEEYMQRQQDSLERETDQIPSQPALIVLSARTAEQLHEQVQRLLNWLEQQEWSKQAVGQPQEQSKARSLLDNLAYTLQVGREAMEERLAVLVASLQELEEKLHSYVSSSAHEGGDWYRGQVKRNDPMRAFAADEDGQKTIAAWISKGKYEKLLEWWVRGLTVDWEDLHREHRPRRISLPTYPFARQRYWISTPKVESAESLTRPAPPQGTHKGCRDTGTDTPREPFRTIVGASLVGALGEETLPRRISLPPRPSLMETTLLIPGWKEAEIPSPGPSEGPLLASVATRGLVPVVFLCELASIHASRIQAQMASGERCRSLHSQRARRKERFQDIVVQLTQEIQSLLRSRLPGKQVEAMGMGLASPPSAAVPLLVQVVVASREEPSFLEALVRVLRTAQLEFPKLQGQLIEVEGEPEEGDLLIWLRQNQSRPHEQHIRYRDGKRWVREWQECLHIPAPVSPPWKESGCYLISGGAGGLGRLFVQEISRHVEAATIILLGRSVLSAEQRAQLEPAAKLGIHIDYQQVDVNDKPAVHGLIEKVLQQYGHLNGIIHAAGVLRDSLLVNKTPEDILAVLAPKIAGVEHLDEASREIPLVMRQPTRTWMPLRMLARQRC
ncbi:MAG: SDR family NAD(P)-dependent oxidoreductase, partial [Chloroflexi bacterium]